MGHRFQPALCNGFGFSLFALFKMQRRANAHFLCRNTAFEVPEHNKFCAFLVFISNSGSSTVCRNEYFIPYFLHPVPPSLNTSFSNLKGSLQRYTFVKERMENLATLDPQLLQNSFSEAQPLLRHSVFRRGRGMGGTVKGNNRYGRTGTQRCENCRKRKRKV